MRIFSGIQPTGDKHLGNYAAASASTRATQEQGEAFFCIVDLHSISVEYDPTDLREATLDLRAMLFATGLDPERSTSSRRATSPRTPRRTGCSRSVTSFGELRRMTQFKDKSDEPGVRLGRRSSPTRCSMAGDILLYQTDIVPVGDRPAPAPRAHARRRRALQLALRRDVHRAARASTRRMGAKVMDLQEPEKKMSTTAGTEQGTVLHRSTSPT